MKLMLRHPRANLILCATLGLGCFASFGCIDAPAAPTDTDLAQAKQEVIGGVDAQAASLDAIGSIGLGAPRYPGAGTQDTAYEYFCTAALISPTTVLTAKHCAEVDAQYAGGPDGIKTYFAIGANASAPKRLVEVVELEMAPGDTGGFISRGSDVAVLHLAEAITDIRPLRVSTLGPEHVGQRFQVIGYGVQNNQRDSGTRKTGSLTLHPLRGRLFELMFGNADAFLKVFRDNAWTAFSATTNGLDKSPFAHAPSSANVSTNAGPAADAASDAGSSELVTDVGLDWYDEQRINTYNHTLLFEGYDAYLGNVEGDAQPCEGDSGGPLIKYVDGERVIYGVASGALKPNHLVCDYGVVYAIFAPDTMAFLENAKTWVDPCDGLSYNGKCDEDVAFRCTSRAEGKRRSTQTECALFGQTCGIDASGYAACVDVP